MVILFLFFLFCLSNAERKCKVEVHDDKVILGTCIKLHGNKACYSSPSMYLDIFNEDCRDSSVGSSCSMSNTIVSVVEGVCEKVGILTSLCKINGNVLYVTDDC
jgi:hypothetical protein